MIDRESHPVFTIREAQKRPAPYWIQSIRSEGPLHVTLSNGEREISLDLDLRQLAVWDAFEQILADAHCDLADQPSDFFRVPEKRAWWLSRVAEVIQQPRGGQ